jgi:hypothetical protein
MNIMPGTRPKAPIKRISWIGILAISLDLLIVILGIVIITTPSILTDTPALSAILSNLTIILFLVSLILGFISIIKYQSYKYGLTLGIITICFPLLLQVLFLLYILVVNPIRF